VIACNYSDIAAPTKLEGRGGPLRHFCWYDRKAEPTGRTWQSRQAGGLGVVYPTVRQQDQRLEQLRARLNSLQSIQQNIGEGERLP
jgi:hypothetical protein